MAVNWSAYDAAKELYGDNVENIQDIGSRFPLFARAVMAINDDMFLDVLKAIPKVTARVMETGLKGVADDTEDAAEETPKEVKAEKKAAPKAKAEPETDTDGDENLDYETMTSKALYKLCCDRGISSQCKKRDKASLIAVLKANEGGNDAEDADDWDEEEGENEPEKDPYAGKTAKELFKMCQDRKIKTRPKQNASVYAELLKKADAAQDAEDEDDDDDDDDWEI